MTELFIDSKRDVDQQLKSTCEDFIHHVTELFTEPLQTFLSRVSVCVTELFTGVCVTELFTGPLQTFLSRVSVWVTELFTGPPQTFLPRVSVWVRHWAGCLLACQVMDRLFFQCQVFDAHMNQTQASQMVHQLICVMALAIGVHAKQKPVLVHWLVCIKWVYKYIYIYIYIYRVYILYHLSAQAGLLDHALLCVSV